MVFFNTAKNHLDNIYNINMAKNFATIPHLVFGANVNDKARFGIDLFYERTGYSDVDTTFDDDDVTKLESIDATISNLGIRTDVMIDLGTFSINPFLTFAKPIISGTQIVDNQAGDTKTTTTVQAYNTLHLKTGVSAKYTNDNTAFKGQARYTQESRQIITDREVKSELLDTTISDTTDHYKRYQFDIYAGLSHKTNNNLTLGMTYRLYLFGSATTTIPNDEDDKDIVSYQKTSCS